MHSMCRTLYIKENTCIRPLLIATLATLDILLLLLLIFLPLLRLQEPLLRGAFGVRGAFGDLVVEVWRLLSERNLKSATHTVAAVQTRLGVGLCNVSSR